MKIRDVKIYLMNHFFRKLLEKKREKATLKILGPKNGGIVEFLNKTSVVSCQILRDNQRFSPSSALYADLYHFKN